jgi:hypothetical protein
MSCRGGYHIVRYTSPDSARSDYSARVNWYLAIRPHGPELASWSLLERTERLMSQVPGTIRPTRSRLEFGSQRPLPGCCQGVTQTLYSPVYLPYQPTMVGVQLNSQAGIVDQLPNTASRLMGR